MNNHMLITSDGVCDLPASYIKDGEFDIIWSYVNVGNATFLDGEEITASNVIEYYETEHKKATTSPPSAEEYAEFFRSRLEYNDVILHISISSYLSKGYENAVEAKKLLGVNGDRVFIVDSLSLSTGMALLIVKAIEMKKINDSASEIQAYLNEYKKKINMSFMVPNLDYMLINGKVDYRKAKRIRVFKLRPVLNIVDGRFKMKIVAGISVQRFVTNLLKKPNIIDTGTLFITHVGLTTEEIEYIKQETLKIIKFDNIIVTEASAAATSSCGPGTVAVSFAYKD